MSKDDIKAELRSLRADVKYNWSAAALAAALVRARAGEGILPDVAPVSTISVVSSPQWTQVFMCRLIEVVFSLRQVIAALTSGYTREQLDTHAASPWTRVAEVFNTESVDAWDDAPDGTELLAQAAAGPIAEKYHRTWSYLKDKWSAIKSAYTAPHARYTASGQGDPDAVFGNFLHAGDTHPKVLTYLHYRMQSIADTVDVDGVASRLIRPDAISDNDATNTAPRRRRSSTGAQAGFLDSATEADLTRLFSRPTDTTTSSTANTSRLGLLMTHYPHLADDVQRDVDRMIREEADSLKLDLRHQHDRAEDERDQRRRRLMTPQELDDELIETQADQEQRRVNEEAAADDAEAEGGDGFD